MLNRRVLFISYNGMLEPLGQTQVLPYLRELAKRGVKFTLLSFERDKAFTVEGQRACDELKRELAEQGIEWHWLRYHQRPSLPATAYDVCRRHSLREWFGATKQDRAGACALAHTGDDRACVEAKVWDQNDLRRAWLDG